MSDNGSGLKLLISYDIDPEEGREYYEFALGKYVPTMQSMGLELSEAWHTAYGNYPNRLIGFIAKDEETMWDLLNDETWEELNEELLNFVSNLDYKVVRYSIGFQI